MYTESQVQDDDGRNAANLRDYGQRSGDCVVCRLCGASVRKPKHWEENRCKNNHICRCGAEFVGPNTGRVPALKEHQKECEVYKVWRRDVNVKNGERGYASIVERGCVEEWKVKIGKAVSETIMSDPVEIERRKELAKTTIGAWARSEDGRRKSSETAKIVSLRPDVMEKRAAKLRRWREEHPDDFYKKVTLANQLKETKPQACLLSLCQTLDSSFLGNQQIFDTSFSTKMKRRQVDILHMTNKIVVEFDGIWHFKKMRVKQKFEEVQAKDAELNSILSARGYVVIRVAYDQFSYRGGGMFTPEVAETIERLVKDPVPGVYEIGESYER